MFISTAAYSPDSRLLASASCDSSVRVWDMRRATYACVLTQFDDMWVTDLSWSPDGSHLATIDTNGIVRVWHGTTVALQIRGSGWCRTVDWSPDGRSLATGGMGNVQIWSLGGGVETATRAVAPPIEAAPNATLRFDGLYQHMADSYSSFIRFFPDGRVFGVSSSGSAHRVAEWLGAPGNESSGVGSFRSHHDGRVEFAVVSESGRVTTSAVFCRGATWCWTSTATSTDAARPGRSTASSNVRACRRGREPRSCGPSFVGCVHVRRLRLRGWRTRAPAWDVRASLI